MKVRTILLAAAAAAVLAARPWLRRWGATIVEEYAPMPGDDLGTAAPRATRAVTLQAPPKAVWPELLRVTGFAASARPEREPARVTGFTAGARPEPGLMPVTGFAADSFPEPEVGVTVPGRLARIGCTVARVEPGRALVLTRDTGGTTVIRSAVLRDLGDGRTRLIARTSLRTAAGATGWLSGLRAKAADLVTTSGQLLLISRRAGRSEHRAAGGDRAGGSLATGPTPVCGPPART
ncbi:MULTISPECIES: hypothetical protein [unclassified Nonomuraea]